MSHFLKQAKGLGKILHMAIHSTDKKALFLDWNDHKFTNPFYSGNNETPHSKMMNPF